MSRILTAIMLISLLSSVAYAQDSGPGPDPAGSDTQKQYDVVLYQHSSTQKGAMIFAAPAAASSTRTNGDLTATLNEEQYSGTWRAYDLGTFAFWYAQADGSTHNLTVIGWATPDFIVGWASMSSTSSGNWFFRWFARTTYLLHGNAAVTLIPN
jgi:hypothetical protein